jgi:S-adenosylmethionine synthetase
LIAIKSCGASTRLCVHRMQAQEGLVVERMEDPQSRAAEFVERKGRGHPDTLCDAVAEAVSVALSRAYLERFDRILHHNVDKVLLVGGESAPAFGGGRLVRPIRIVLAGRATRRVGGDVVDVDAIAIEAGRAAIRASLRHVDALRDVVWESRIGPGSVELASLFARGASGAALANDSSAGVGFAPLSPLERAVLDIEHRLNAPESRPHAACGEDVKVAGIRRRDEVELMVACAGIDRELADASAYERFRAATHAAAGAIAAHHVDLPTRVVVNAADRPASGEFYLTVTGTSAEAGDDGETGRGNRVNGLIAVGRPMTMEATAGKNPISHVGKLYNVAAQRLAETLVGEIDAIRAAECVLASRIGTPISRPALAHLRVALAPGVDLAEVEPAIRDRVAHEAGRVAALWQDLVAGEVTLF